MCLNSGLGWKTSVIASLRKCKPKLWSPVPATERRWNEAIAATVVQRRNEHAGGSLNLESSWYIHIIDEILSLNWWFWKYSVYRRRKLWFCDENTSAHTTVAELDEPKLFVRVVSVTEGLVLFGCQVNRSDSSSFTSETLFPSHAKLPASVLLAATVGGTIQIPTAGLFKDWWLRRIMRLFTSTRKTVLFSVCAALHLG